MQRFSFFALLFSLSTLLFWQCESDASTMQSFDLLEYGVPMSIRVPVDSPQVKMSEGFLGDKEVSIKAGEGFDVLLTYAPASTSDMAQLKAEQLGYVKSISNFERIVEEEEAGFIYETAIDSTQSFYGFRYIRLQGDIQYLFQSGLIGTFALEDAQMMYAAVKEEE
ncbi:MAG: hypothetical protein AAGI23_01500 [Bacteroidota bacterium]